MLPRRDCTTRMRTFGVAPLMAETPTGLLGERVLSDPGLCPLVVLGIDGEEPPASLTGIDRRAREVAARLSAQLRPRSPGLSKVATPYWSLRSP
jgi:hypothetical protein